MDGPRENSETNEKPETQEVRELLSLRAYALRRGVALSTVQAAIKNGRIRTVPGPDGKPKIDPLEADRDFAQNTDPSKQGRKQAQAASSPAPRSSASSLSGEQCAEVRNSFRYMSARARRELYVAKLKKLEFQKREGALVEKAEIDKDAFETARAVRDALMTIPDRISAQLAAESDPHKVRLLLEGEILKALRALTGE
jgi:hypothetical protein